MKRHCLLFSLNSKFTQSNLAIHYLKSYSEKHLKDWNFETLELSINLPLATLQAELMERVSDVLAVSCYIWNIEIVRKLLSNLRQLRPDITIILGGHEVSFDPQTYLKANECDYVISGEGEEKFRSLLASFDQKADFPQIDGLSYLKDGQVVQTPANSEVKELDQIPSPFLEGSPLLEQDFVYYEASRGCVYKCHFCLSALDRGTRFFSLDRFESDMEVLLSRDNLKQIKFVDRTFNLNVKRSNFIFEYLIKNGGKRNFHFEIQAELFKKSTLDILKKAPDGLFQFEIGVQSWHQAVLDKNGRQCRLEKLEQNLRTLLEETKVHIHLDLIAGLNGESPQQFKHSFNRVFDFKPHHLQVETLKILKGSLSLRYNSTNGYVYQQSPPYSLLKSPDWSYSELREVEEIGAILEVFYNRDPLHESTLFLLDKFPSPFEFFSLFNSFLKSQGQSYTGIALKRSYELLHEFARTNDLLSCEFLEVLSIDYLKRFPHGGKTPWHKPSTTLPSGEFREIAAKQGWNRKGFLEVLSKGTFFYFTGKPENLCFDITNEVSNDVSERILKNVSVPSVS